MRVRCVRFLDPEAEGRLLAMREALAGRGLEEAAALVESGALRTADGAALAWEPADQVLPVSHELRARFETAAYAKARDAARDRLLERGLRVVE